MSRGIILGAPRGPGGLSVYHCTVGGKVEKSTSLFRGRVKHDIAAKIHKQF